ncbi:IS66 family transposase [Cystobacter fuscus]|uniref:IS66 family transposase n=1 Tax=Cystobacter fuscus TaxID=43 RepID=UPI003B286494
MDPARLEFHYESYAGHGGRFTLVNCWAHVRRKFVECEDRFPQATEAIELIGEVPVSPG